MSNLSNLTVLQERAQMLAEARAFFAKRDILEVDCPALSQAAPIDAHIDVMEVSWTGVPTHYLHTSPEYGMKRLLSQNSGDIYQMSHVFRAEESGPLHRPEFTMVEWYRQNLSFEELIDETLDFTRLFLGQISSSSLAYRESFLRYAKIDYIKATPQELFAFVQEHELGLNEEAKNWDKDTLLQCLFSFLVEPKLGQNELTVIFDFPASQAALSETERKGDEEVAKRFEIYKNGIELANGYKELTDATEQRARLHASNEKRVKLGKKALPIDEEFLKALERGLPPCCGVAVGFDRLMMLRLGAAHIRDIIPL